MWSELRLPNPLIFLIIFSTALFGISWRLDPSRRLFRIVGFAALAQAVVSIGLFFLSTHPPELLKPKVIGPGFWVPFGDGQNYFLKSQAWIYSGIPNPGGHPPSALFVTLLGVAGLGSDQPILSGLWLNGCLHLLLMPLTYYVLRKRSEISALWVCSGLGFLPSSLLYTSQLLRDPLLWLFLIGALVSLLILIGKAGKCGSWMVWIGLVLVLAMLAEMRDWWGYVFTGSIFLALLSGKNSLAFPSQLAAISAVFFGLCLGSQHPVSTILKAYQNAEFITRKTEFQVPLQTGDKRNLDTNLANYNPADLFKRYYNAALTRLQNKWGNIKNKPPIFFIAFFIIDLFFLKFWLTKLKALNIKPCKLLFPPLFYKKFLGILVFCLSLTSIVYADAFGNLTRYAAPILSLLMIFLALKNSLGNPKKRVYVKV